MSDERKLRTTNMVVAALGGEGGGVFTNWLIAVAKANGWIAQTTFLAGVAQRTGATIYYIELFPREHAKKEMPVMSLFPAQGDIDIALSSEIAEAGRMVQRGFVTPERTTLISSTHRVYGITEKISLSDGTINPAVLHRMAKKYAKEFLRYDMQVIASRHQAVISSVLLGALAGSGALPFSKQSFVAVILKTDRSVEANLAAFEESYQAATSGEGAQDSGVQRFEPKTKQPKEADKSSEFQLPAAQTKPGAVLLERLGKFPKCTHFNLYHGLRKTVEYQDFAYATQYLDELTDILALDRHDENYQLTNTVARYLALWMCFEDIARVARLKIRKQRMAEIREEVQADDGQIIYVTEYFSPRAEEVCAILPAGIGGFLMRGRRRQAMLNALIGGGKKLRTNTVSVYLMLRFIALLGRFRRSSLGYRGEHQMIQAWLAVVKSTAQEDAALALELARCGSLVKGYSDTRARTTSQLSAIVEKVRERKIHHAEDATRLRTAALADDNNTHFQAELGG